MKKTPNTNNVTLVSLIKTAVTQDERLWNEDKTELNQVRLIDLVEQMDKTIIDLLFTHEEVRKTFFINVGNSYVFNTHAFRFFMEENKVANSYTAYKNRIGLSDGTRFLKDGGDVVLNFPYKDCVLEGGQACEEGKDTYFEHTETVSEAQKNKGLQANTYNKKTATRKEIFFNSVLAHDEIDRLFDAKALTKWKRYSSDGAREVGEIARNADGIIEENLIIKGNNLLALHSLKKQFAGKIKLIYIDPPYNTGNDGFHYNDNFNHSTWLVFMKNRLEVARELLRDDGVIFVQCDDNEQAYLKVLMDEVFGRDNFVANFIWNHRKSSQNDIDVSLSHNYGLTYSKDRKKSKLNTLEIDFNKFSNPDKDSRGKWIADPFDAPNIRPNLTYPIVNPNTKQEFLPPEGRCWRMSKEKFEEALKDNRIVFGKTGKAKPQYKRFESDAKEKGTNPFTIWSDIETATQGTQEIIKLFNGKEFNTPKPEGLLKRVIELSTKPGDIVLDYHLGSATTCAVAHKMNRQYIGIEQMDYIEPIVVERLKKVIAGEQGGVSKALQWQGGGDFVYCELAKWNEAAKETIGACTNLEALESFFDKMYSKYFLNYNVKIKEFKEQVLREAEFRNLSLDEQKRIFIAMLDNNQMYVCASEMADAKYRICETDQKMTEEFYNEELRTHRGI